MIRKKKKHAHKANRKADQKRIALNLTVAAEKWKICQTAWVAARETRGRSWKIDI